MKADSRIPAKSLGSVEAYFGTPLAYDRAETKNQLLKHGVNDDEVR